jgi:hypothetical protein
MRYKVGDQVRVKSLDWYNQNKNNDGFIHLPPAGFVEVMSKFCGHTFTITSVNKETYNVDGSGFHWTDEMFECKVESVTQYDSEDNIIKATSEL